MEAISLLHKNCKQNFNKCRHDSGHDKHRVVHLQETICHVWLFGHGKGLAPPTETFRFREELKNQPDHHIGCQIWIGVGRSLPTDTVYGILGGQYWSLANMGMTDRSNSQDGIRTGYKEGGKWEETGKD